MTNAEKLGNKLYELRKKAGLSQEEFAENLNVSRQAVSKWERGETLPDTDNLITIAKLFNVSLDELIDNEIKSENEPKIEPVDDNQTNIDGLNLNVEEQEPILDCDEDEIFYSVEGIPVEKNHSVFSRIIISLPYPILVTIGFLLWGFLAPNGFSVSWTLFLTIPLYYSIIDCIVHRKVSEFLYPALLVAIYCFIGMQWNLWHPYWIMFITIPIFYCIADAIDKR